MLKGFRMKKFSKRSYRRHLCLFLVFLFTSAIVILVNPVNKAYASDEYDGIREKYEIKITGYDPANPYDVNDEYIQMTLDRLGEDTNKYWSSMDKTLYTWNDLKDSSLTVPANLNVIVARLRAMATAWAAYGSDYYGNASLLSDTINGLEWVYDNRYNDTVNPSTGPNWWYWEIGIPLELNKTVILLYEQLTSTQIEKYMDAVDHFTPTVYTSSILVPTVNMTGANRLWKCSVVGTRAIIMKDLDKLQEASDGLDDVFEYVTDGDGFYQDGSYIQHGYFPYAGGYGQALFSSLSEMLWLLGGSTWDNDNANKDNVYEWIFDTFEPAMFKGTILESVRGREASRPSKPAIGSGIINSLLMLAEIPDNPYVDEYKSIIKYHIQNGYQDIYFRGAGRWNIVKAVDILKDPSISPATELVGNYQFYNQDRVIHRQDGWAFDIAMHSDRIKNYEMINAENLRSWYIADGMTYLYRDAADYSYNFWPTVDPHRLPGITVDRDTSRPDLSTDGTFMLSSWVGGVSLEDLYGTAGMDFKQHNYSNMDLAAKKSWFMFDGEVAALGAGISSTSGRTIETVVENRALNSVGDDTLTVNGTVKSSSLGWSETMTGVDWIQLEGSGGYVFPDSVTLKGLRESREGSWYDINHVQYYNADDEFNKTTQGGAWMWVREDNTKYSFSGTSVDIVSQQGTLEGAKVRRCRKLYAKLVSGLCTAI